MYPGGRAGAHSHLLQHPAARAHSAVCVCASLQEQQLGTAGSRNLQDVQGRSLALPRSSCWNVQYRLQKLTSSTVLIWLRVLLCPMSLVQCALLSCAQAPLLNPLLVFYSACLFWVLLPGTRRDPAPFQSQLATLVNLDGFALPQRCCFLCLLLAASSGYTCDPCC